MFTGPGKVVFQAGCKEIHPSWFGNEGVAGIQAAANAIEDPATIVVNKATPLTSVRHRCEARRPISRPPARVCARRDCAGARCSRV
jgi:hypothetical protein